MKKILLLLLLIPSLLQAQRWHLNLFGGMSNYTGDLQDKTFTLNESYGAFGAGIQYDLTPKLAVLVNGMSAHVGASDAYNKPSLRFRNLSFQTQIIEGNILAEYSLLDITQHRFTPYITAGFAIFHFNPYAYDSTGHKIYLQPLSTEGEGLATTTVPNYSLTQIAIPLGIGVKLRITDRVTLAYEIVYRKLFTDYLDDVSGKYVDEATLLAAKGPTAVEMAYRAGELKGGDPNYPAAGTLRGSSKYKDIYYFTGIRLIITLGDPNRIHGDRGRIDCPKPPVR